MLKICLRFLTLKEKVMLKKQHHSIQEESLSAQTLPSFFHSLSFSGEKYPDEEIRNFPEAVYRTILNLLIAANNAILDLLISTHNTVLHGLGGFLRIEATLTELLV